MYRKNATTALLTRVTAPEDCFVVQYVHNAPPTPDTAAAHSGSAVLSVRYVGRPVLDAEKTAVKSFEYAEALPAFISRVVPSRAQDTTLVVLGDGEREVEFAPPLKAPL